MRKKYGFIFIVVFLAIFAIQCGKSSGPTVPGIMSAGQAGDAVLIGSIALSGANAVDFSQIMIGIEGTSLQTRPDQNGNFHLSNLPYGNLTVEVEVKSTVTNLILENVQSREEIKAQIEINDNDAARWTHMERHRKAEAALTLEIRPPNWNVDWVNSPDDDLANFKIYGDGIEDIDPESVAISCVESGLTIGWPDYTWELGGVYLKIFITQQAAIGLVPDAQRGEVYHFNVTCNVDSSAIAEPLADTVSIVGKRGKGDLIALEAKISPKKWNTSWTSNDGQVTAQIRGSGFEDIIDSTFILTCVESGRMLAYEKFQFSLGGSLLSAKFSKQDALSLIDDPSPGMMCEILVEADVDGGDPMSETCFIEIVGKKK